MIGMISLSSKTGLVSPSIFCWMLSKTGANSGWPAKSWAILLIVCERPSLERPVPDRMVPTGELALGGASIWVAMRARASLRAFASDSAALALSTRETPDGEGRPCALIFLLTNLDSLLRRPVAASTRRPKPTMPAWIGTD